ncbi:DUF4214 domain-containing protein [Pseudoroseomonas wenyumeiae]|uniref:DUF4214 domain-containing protein n=1 Tax=Teichococcus wenyumeiae TaxID=2478470 RepID=A0A3A9JMR0_9PROT|nr:DUF4214 domain-containing protein [Pseudoroseomonas wenyumeiae]RKK05116.1 DUF4214 domain-containing protein [Pseudoroseomonas wenyumeiae]RMI20942.1 DUF4214 domain-containing protein [Pseudoroseomonas wenyumeiae]
MASIAKYQIPAASGVITGSNGADTYNGTGAYDFGQFDAGRRDAIIVNNDAGPVSVASRAGIDTINSVETLIFVDGREVYNPEDAAAQVTRLYNVALGRDADQGGLNSFIQTLDDGGKLSNVANDMINSAEFSNLFGANLNNTQFVDALYQNMRGAAASPAEISSWTILIDKGEMTRADVAVQFAESAENRAITASIVADGIWDRDEGAIAVANLYDTAFDRLPDLGGLSSWVSLLHTGNLSVKTIADSFYNSDEAASLRGLNDADFINAVYNNALERNAEQAGVDGWLAQLNGGMSRAEVMLAISDSAEHQQITANDFQSDNPLSYGVSLVA